MGFGEVGGQILFNDPGESASSYSTAISYSQLSSALAALGAPGSSSLPASSPYSGTLNITTADEKALGLIAANGTGQDGSIGFSVPLFSKFFYDPTHSLAVPTGYVDFMGIVEHEMSEVLGRISTLSTGSGTYSPLDLFRYSATGVPQTGTGGPAFFSTNGTVSASSYAFNTTAGADLGDWATSVGADSFGAYVTNNAIMGVSQTDYQVMQAIGWTGTGYLSDSQINPAVSASAAVAAFHSGAAPVVVLDSAANVQAAIDGLGSMAAANGLASITLNDALPTSSVGGLPTLTVTAAQLANDVAALELITNGFTLAITGATATNIATVAAQAASATGVGHSGDENNVSIAVTDSSANVLANLTALESAGAKFEIGSVTLTDANASLTMTESAYMAAEQVLRYLTNGSLTITGVAAADLSTMIFPSHTTIEISDSAANVIAHLGDIGTRLYGNTFQITLTDSNTPTLSLTGVQWESSWNVIELIQSNYHLAITGVGAYYASNLVGNAHLTSITVSDSAYYVGYYLDSLQSLVASHLLTGISLTDSSTPTLSVSAAQLTADAGALAAITGHFNYSISGITVANSAAILAESNVSSISILDSDTNVANDLDGLQALAASGKLTGIAFTNTTQFPALHISEAQFTADAQAIAAISVGYSLYVSGFSVASALAQTSNIFVFGMTISDSAANVAANIDALQGLARANKLTGITLTDSGTPTLSLTAAQISNDPQVLALIHGAEIVLSGSLTVSQLITQSSSLASVAVADTAAHISASLDLLQSDVASGTVASISLTDGGTPTLSLLQSQLIPDARALAAISGTYNLSVTGVTVANLSSTLAQSKVASVSVSDTAAHISADLDGLQSLASSGKLAGIAVTDGQPITVTGTQLSGDSGALASLTGSYFLSLQGLSATQAVSEAANAHVVNISVSDSAANVMANIGSLGSAPLSALIGSVTFTDSGTPKLSLSAAQLNADAQFISRISSPYTLDATGLTVNAFLNLGSHISTGTIADSAANISTSLDGLQASAAAGTLTGITLTDSGTPTLAITDLQFSIDMQALHEISGAYHLTVSEVPIIALSSTLAAANVTSAGVVDSAANIGADLDTLQSLVGAGKITSIAATDDGTLTVTAAQLVSDAQALSEITGSYTLTVSGGATSVSQLTPSVLAHTGSLSVSDSAANIASNLDALQSLATTGKLGSVAVTGTGYTDLTVTAAQLTSDAAVLKQITGNYVLDISASANDSTIDGLAGHGDVVSYSGAVGGYTLTPGSNGEVTVTGPSGSDHLSGINAIQIGSQTDIVAQTPLKGGAANTGNLTELYGAVFARLPDVPGLGFYEANLAANPNTSLPTFAEYFLSSPEYTSNTAHQYAQTVAGESQFITDSYTNLLGRQPEAGAVPFYLNVINQYTAGLTPGTAAYAAADLTAHAYVLTYFSASSEFLGDVSITAQNPSSSQHWLLLTN